MTASCTSAHAVMLHIGLVTAGDELGVIDVNIRDVKPTGATAPYASPEVLCSLQQQYEGAEDDVEGVMVNGCIADMWSLACVLYEMLTGEIPFLPKDEDYLTRQAPSSVPDCLQKQWLMFDAFAEAQNDWVGSPRFPLFCPFSLMSQH